MHGFRRSYACDSDDCSRLAVPHMLFVMVSNAVCNASPQANEESLAVLGSRGLGLLLVRQYLHAAGSKLEVASSDGHGTTFSFTLPLADGALVFDGSDDASSSTLSVGLEGARQSLVRLEKPASRTS